VATYRTAASTYAIQQVYYGSTGAAVNTAGLADYGATQVPGQGACPIRIQQLIPLNAWSVPNAATITTAPLHSRAVMQAVNRASNW
jgi:hypothetical protein